MAPKCKICSEVYSPGKQEPLSLPCGHSFCRQCVENIVKTQGSLRCPTCRKDHASIAVSSLSVNYDLLSASISSVTTVTPTEATPQEAVSILVKDLQDHTNRLIVPLSHTVMQVKAKLQAQYGVPDTTRLLFRGQRLQDEKTLAYYGVTTGSVIQMSTRFLGALPWREGEVGLGCVFASVTRCKTKESNTIISCEF